MALKEVRLEVWTAFVRLRLGTSNALLWTWSWTFGFYEMQGMS